MSRPSIYAEVQAAYKDSTSVQARTLQSLLALGAYLSATPASGSNSFADVIAAFTAAGVPLHVVHDCQRLMSNNLNPHA
jgi:hypothetical protein